MKPRKNALRTLSPWLIVIYFLISSWIGISLIDVLLRSAGHSFHTIVLMVSIVAACYIESLIDLLGHLLGGWIGGLEVLMIRLGNHVYVKENGKFVSRDLCNETNLFPVLMCEKKNRFSYVPYMMGGAVLSILSAVLAFVFLWLSPIRVESILGTFLAAFILAGFWSGSFSLLPCYFGYAPNDGMKLVLFLKNEKAGEAFRSNMKLLKELSEAADTDGLSLENCMEPDLDADDDRKSMNVFRSSYLLRAYEYLMWKGKLKEASEILAVLYYHLDDFTDEMQVLVIQEVVFCLCVMGNNEETELADRLINPGRKKILERSMTPEAIRALLLWSLHHVEMKKEMSRYYKSLKERIESVPYPAARFGWMEIIKKRYHLA